MLLKPRQRPAPQRRRACFFLSVLTTAPWPLVGLGEARPDGALAAARALPQLQYTQREGGEFEHADFFSQQGQLLRKLSSVVPPLPLPCVVQAPTLTYPSSAADVKQATHGLS